MSARNRPFPEDLVIVPKAIFRRWLRHWMGIPVLTFFVLIIQTITLNRQATIMNRQTELMSREGGIAETQQELGARPNIETSIEAPKAGDAVYSLKWKIANRGPYSVRNLRFRVLYFKKYLTLGWQDSISEEREAASVLATGQDTTVDLTSDFMPYSINDRQNHEFPTVQGGEFYVISLIFERVIDDKRYMYLQPFQKFLSDQPPKELRLDLTSMAGPVAKSCLMDAYAVELTYEFYKRNPLPYPVEPYNYHYLLGQPTSICLESGPKSLRW